MEFKYIFVNKNASFPLSIATVSFCILVIQNQRGEIPISLIHNSFSYHCTPNVVFANGFDLKQRLLEDHRKENKDILTRHFYDMSNMMSRNEGVWLSNGWVKTLLWIFLLCFLYTVISIAYFVASYIDK